MQARDRVVGGVEFVPFSIEAGGVWGPAAKKFFRECLALADDDRDVDLYHWMQPRSPVSTSQGLARMRREAVERDTLEHMRDLSTLRDEVADAAELASEYYKQRFDERTSTWRDEALLQPGKKVWLEMRGIDMPANRHGASAE